MNPQTLSRVKHAVRKSRIVTDALTAFCSMLTVFAILPYELGDASLVIPPEWKANLAIAGVFSTALLRAIRPLLPSPHAPAPKPVEQVHEEEGIET